MNARTVLAGIWGNRNCTPKLQIVRRHSSATPPAKSRKRDDVSTPVADSPPDSNEGLTSKIEGYADLTLHELIAKFGTDVQFRIWLESPTIIENVREKRLKNEDLEGSLISRELVRTRVFTAAKTDVPLQDAEVRLRRGGSFALWFAIQS